METHFTWKTKLFSRTFEIYEYDILVGKLEKERWSRRTSAEIKGFSLMYVTKGFFKQTALIINTQEDREIGRIAFNSWRFRANIQLNGREYNFRFDNFFMTRWTIANENDVTINYWSGAFKGTIDSSSDSSILALTGLYIRNYFKSRQASAAAAS
jgi:hypothetical protein